MLKKQGLRTMLVFVTTFALVFTATSAMAQLLVDVDWLKANSGRADVKIVDVQNKSATYAKGHIPGALKVTRKIDLGDYTRYPANKYPQKEQFLALMIRLGIDNNDTVVAYDDHHGIFAARLLFIMEMYGHDTNKLKILDGGIVQWKKTNNPIATEETVKPVVVGNYRTSKPNLNLVVSWNNVLRDVLQRQGSNTVLHDARPAVEYAGKRIRAIRGGHIPMAINLTGQDAANDKESHLFKSVDQIKAAFVNAGLTPDKTIYTYCHSSDRSAHVYMVLTHMLGYKNVKIYDGAWKEWGTMTALPASAESWDTGAN